ncbi:MAG TPA: hypothetical protein V6C96_04220 [Vampirovibrionales bacterium]
MEKPPVGISLPRLSSKDLKTTGREAIFVPLSWYFVEPITSK